MEIENPYEPPTSMGDRTEELIDGDDRQRLRNIARAHRQVIVSVLLYLCAFPFIVAFANMGRPSYEAAVAMAVVLACGIAFAAVSTFKLVAILGGYPVAVICSLGLLVPVVGWLVLVLTSQIASTKLKENGIHVGLFGADADLI